MALKVWLPLNGDLHNQGLSNISATNHGATVNNNGKIGKCYSLDGTDDYIQGPSFTVPSSGEFSVCGWYYHNANKSWGRLFEFTTLDVDGAPSGKTYTGLGLSSGTTPTIFNRVNDTAGNNISTGISFTTGNWYHWVSVYNKSNIKVYINGSLVKETTFQSFAGTTFTYTHFGKSSWTGDQYLNGRINDLRIYDHALSPKEVKELSKGLVLHYKLDNILHNKIYDSSGYHNNGTISGTLTLDDDSPRYGKCTVFGTSQHIYNANGGIPGASGSELTVSCWFYQTDRTGYQGLVGNRGAQGSSNSSSPLNWYLYTHSNDGSIQFHGSAQNKSTIIPSLNTWHHVVAVVKYTNKYDLYLDGTKVISDVSYTWGSTAQRTIVSGYGSSNNETFKGKISDVRIYATALSEADIKDLYDTPTFIDNQGDLLTGEFVEDDEILVDKTGITAATQFKEDGTETQFYNTKLIQSTQILEI